MQELFSIAERKNKMGFVKSWQAANPQPRYIKEETLQEEYPLLEWSKLINKQLTITHIQFKDYSSGERKTKRVVIVFTLEGKAYHTIIPSGSEYQQKMIEAMIAHITTGATIEGMTLKEKKFKNPKQEWITYPVLADFE